MPESKERWQQQTCKGTGEAKDILWSQGLHFPASPIRNFHTGGLTPELQFDPLAWPPAKWNSILPPITYTCSFPEVTGWDWSSSHAIIWSFWWVTMFGDYLGVVLFHHRCWNQAIFLSYSTLHKTDFWDCALPWETPFYKQHLALIWVETRIRMTRSVPWRHVNKSPSVATHKAQLITFLK